MVVSRIITTISGIPVQDTDLREGVSLLISSIPVQDTDLREGVSFSGRGAYAGSYLGLADGAAGADGAAVAQEREPQPLTLHHLPLPHTFAIFEVRPGPA
jgi:hypothetical protein